MAACGARDVDHTDPGDLPHALFDEFGDYLYDTIFTLETRFEDVDSVNESISMLPSTRLIETHLSTFPGFDTERFTRGVKHAEEFVDMMNEQWTLKE
jgi:hypothetical protein